ncbi:MAG: hypothetical protein LBM01_03185 [Christensenellaceae bacterium]|jgi:uncharacterized membrane protein YeaQ/YmgE (transglycosylase-associated protein family)|nr:hypothetical protein [Christensenellaceae bacterium]
MKNNIEDNYEGQLGSPSKLKMIKKRESFKKGLRLLVVPSVIISGAMAGAAGGLVMADTLGGAITGTWLGAVGGGTAGAYLSEWIIEFAAKQYERHNKGMKTLAAHAKKDAEAVAKIENRPQINTIYDEWGCEINDFECEFDQQLI